MNLIWLTEARQDVDRLHEFLVEVNPAAAEKAIQLIQEGARSLVRHPEIGRPMVVDSHRRELFLPFGASAYVLRYRVEEDTLVIIRVWHGREDRH
jgi:plasmid stabilization system protein ParE